MLRSTVKFQTGTFDERKENSVRCQSRDKKRAAIAAKLEALIEVGSDKVDGSSCTPKTNQKTHLPSVVLVTSVGMGQIGCVEENINTYLLVDNRKKRLDDKLVIYRGSEYRKMSTRYTRKNRKHLQ